MESDRTTTLQAAIQRGVGSWETEWREWFLPSVDLYMPTEPQNRADLLVAGRGTLDRPVTFVPVHWDGCAAQVIGKKMFQSDS